MTDKELFHGTCIQITLRATRDPDTGILTINDQSYDSWPDSIVVEGQTFVLAEEENDGMSDDEEDECGQESVRAFYDAK